MICSNCGKEVNELSKFCTFCGTPTAAPQTETAPAQEVVAPQPQPTLNPVAPAQAVPQNQEAATPVQAMGGSTVLLGAAETASAASTTLLNSTANVAPTPMGSANGTQPVAPAQLKKKKKKKGKAGLIIVLVLLLLVVGGGCAFIFMQMNQPVNKIETALSSGDLDAAIALFDEIENDEDLEAVTGQALTYAESVKNDYLNEVEGMDYANAYAILTKLSSGILAENAEVTEMIALVDRINISRAAFSSAEKFKDAGRYADAINEYNNVIEEDSAYYQLAQAALTETIDIFRTDALDSAKAYAEAGDYIAAKTVLNEALQVLTNDSSLLSELNVVEAYIQDESITTYLDSINSAIAEGRYADAFDNMETALDDFPDNADLLTLKVTLESSYKEAQMAALNELYIAGDIDAALLLLADMQIYLPDDSEIPSLITQYESYKPTALSALTIYEENCHYAEYTMGVTLTDTYENIHTDAISLTLSHSGNGELVFLNNDKFNRFSGVLAYEYCSNTRGSGHIEVYADDELIYTSPTIDDSTKAFGFEAILPASCHKLKLRWVADNGEYTNLILANAQVYNR